jgi:hypothetical protein
MRGTTLIGCILAAHLLAGTAQAEPSACQPDVVTWWKEYVARYIESNGTYGVNLANSDRDAGFAHMTWQDGVQQMVEVAAVPGLGVCAINRRTIRFAATE